MPCGSRRIHDPDLASIQSYHKERQKKRMPDAAKCLVSKLYLVSWTKFQSALHLRQGSAKDLNMLCCGQIFRGAHPTKSKSNLTAEQRKTNIIPMLHTAALS